MKQHAVFIRMSNDLPDEFKAELVMRQFEEVKRKHLRNSFVVKNIKVSIGLNGEDFKYNRVTAFIKFNRFKVSKIIKKLFIR